MTTHKGNAHAWKPAKERATFLVTFRARPNDVERWDRAARAAGTTRSKWLIALANEKSAGP